MNLNETQSGGLNDATTGKSFYKPLLKDLKSRVWSRIPHVALELHDHDILFAIHRPTGKTVMQYIGEKSSHLFYLLSMNYSAETKLSLFTKADLDLAGTAEKQIRKTAALLNAFPNPVEENLA